MAEAGGGPSSGGRATLKDQGNEFFKAGNYLKAAALYTQAIKLEPSNPTLYRFDIEYFRVKKVFHTDLYHPVRAVCTGPPGYLYADRLLPGGTAKNRSSTVDFNRRQSIEGEIDRRRSIEGEKGKKKKKKKRKRRKKRRRGEEERIPRAVLARLPSPPVGRQHAAAALARSTNLHLSIKAWHETGQVDPRVNFLLDKQKTQTDKYAPVVNIDKGCLLGCTKEHYGLSTGKL
ncbi:hypothetical protein BHM03_00023532 [Ensete ventricosum]|nr:hypothetical protein BHM03_00023532 [Ensete ventricosum]